jgi:hypothetical protein
MQTCLRTGTDVLRLLNFADTYDIYWRNIGLLFAITLFCHILGCIGLSARVYRAR